MSSARPPAGVATLAIEISQRRGSVALRARPGAEILRSDVEPATNERDMLMPAIDALMTRAGCAPAHLGTVVVSIGPGGFTGLRVAVATAKAISLGTGASVIGVPSALVVAGTLAERGLLADGTCAVALASKGETVWLERVQVTNGLPGARTAGLFDASQIPLDGVTALAADEHLPAACAEVARAHGVPRIAAAWDSKACLLIGESILARDGATDPLLLEPLYPRAPEAVTLWDARQRR